MRHLILVFMIALLPLRGWVGDAMAGQMAMDALTQTSAVHAHADHGEHMDAHALHTDCVGHDGQGSDADDQDHCANCAACQICHTPALAIAMQLLPVELAVVPPQAIVISEASAERAPGFKPPIS